MVASLHDGLQWAQRSLIPDILTPVISHTNTSGMACEIVTSWKQQDMTSEATAQKALVSAS